MMLMIEHLMHFLFVLSISYYFMSAMQWYSYRLERVVFHFHRYDWHGYFFVIPLCLYYILPSLFAYGLYLLYPIALFLWSRKLDKKLAFTARVKRFFLFLFFAIIFQTILCLQLEICSKLGVVLPLLIAHFASVMFEKIAFEGFKKEARTKLQSMPELKVVAITASYGKTSIKNFLAHILSSSFDVYATPRSVNTLGGIVKDINESLPAHTQIYIVEAGARERGDIDEIAQLVNPHIAIVGRIGEQHIEYFKTLENIRNTKMELLHSSRLEKAFVHESAHVKPDDKTVVFGSDIRNINATLDGTSFELLLDGEWVGFTCKLLGDFNAINLAAAIHVAKSLGVKIETIQASLLGLKSVEHRLQKIEAGGKLIIDDSFNGNLEGMLSSYELIATYVGRKVIITPGIIESTEEANRILAQKIDSIFDVVILTGKSNTALLDAHIQRPEKIILADKSELQSLLAQKTIPGDVILFSNDAPSFI